MSRHVATNNIELQVIYSLEGTGIIHGVLGILLASQRAANIAALHKVSPLILKYLWTPGWEDVRHVGLEYAQSMATDGMSLTFSALAPRISAARLVRRASDKKQARRW